MDQSIKAGVLGSLLAVIINLFSPIYLYFIPSFLAALFAIYIFRLVALRDGLVAAFMTYIFNEGILGTITLAAFYWANEPYPSFNIDTWMVFSPIVTSITALIAGYIGVQIVQKTKPTQELPPPPLQPLPPI